MGHIHSKNSYNGVMPEINKPFKAMTDWYWQLKAMVDRFLLADFCSL